MNYQSYRRQFFTEPAPEQRYDYAGLHGVTLYFNDYAEAIKYYRNVLGSPAYIEGDGTHGWQIGDTWLTLLKGQAGNPQNIEIIFVMESPNEAERLQAAFIAAGAKGEDPTDQLMYEPVRYCPLRDPFGVNILIISPLQNKEG